MRRESDENITVLAEQMTRKPVSTMGCVGLAALAIPALFLAFACIDTYMQGYNSWKDSLYFITMYVIGSVIAAAVLIAHDVIGLRNQSRQDAAVRVISRLLTIHGLVLLPLALALALERNLGWEQTANPILYFLPMVSVVLSFSSALCLSKMKNRPQVLVVPALILIVCCSAVVAWHWFEMTATSPQDWALSDAFARMISGKRLFIGYLIIVVPATSLAIRRLMQKSSES